MDNIERAASLVANLFEVCAEDIRGTWPNSWAGECRGRSAWLTARGVSGDWERTLIVTILRAGLPGYSIETVVRSEDGAILLVAGARVGPDLLVGIAEEFARAGLRSLNEEIAGRD